jgi:capsid portal protein
VFYCRKWSKYARDIRKYDRWDKGLKQSNSVFYYKNPKSRGAYGLPIWKAAIEDALTAIEITHFHYSAIRNNFVPSAVVNFNNGVPTDEQQDEIEAKLNEKFSGSSNAARLLVSFNDNKDSAVTVERLSEDGFDSKYQALRDSVRDNLLTAFRASGQLFGVLPEQTGFNSVEYLNAFALYKETVVKPLQQEIEDAFKRLGYDISLNEFTVEFQDNGEKTVA